LMIKMNWKVFELPKLGILALCAIWDGGKVGSL
jgi:hypothetical protein